MAAKIQNIACTQFTLAGHVKFNSEVNALIAEFTPVKLHLETIAPQYNAAVNAENNVVNRPTMYAETQRMHEADHERDLSIALVRNLVNAYAASPIKSHSATAAILVAIIAPYRGMQVHEMNRQTTEVDSMCDALRKPAATAALAALHIEETVAQLDLANSNFKAATAARDAESLRRQHIKDADTRTLRAVTNTLYRQMVEQVNAYAIVQPSDEIVSFIDRMNVLVARYKVVIANQGKKWAVEEE